MFKIFNTNEEYEAYYKGMPVQSGDVAVVKGEDKYDIHLFTNNIEGINRNYNGSLKKYFTVKVQSSNEEYGRVEGGGTVEDGQKVTIKAIPFVEGGFLGWSDGSMEAEREITVEEDKTYTASFGQTFTVTVTSSDPTMGTVTGSGTYVQGTMVTIGAIVTNENSYVFDGWNDGNTNATRTIEVQSDMTFTASFELNYLCFTAEEANSTVNFHKSMQAGTYTIPSLKYSYDRKTWDYILYKDGSSSSADTILRLDNIGDKVYIKGDNDYFNNSEDRYVYI